VGTADDHSARIRQGLRRARHEGVALGGLRWATEEKNQEAHKAALQGALAFRETIEAGHEKSLQQLSRDLFSKGCKTKSKGCLTPEMVSRLRKRLKEAKIAVADGDLLDKSCNWDAVGLVRQTVKWRDSVLFRWSLRMVRQEYGDAFVNRVIAHLLRSVDRDWVSASLA
jgi:hypothetical protein